jgi:hypothetical protein
MIIASLVVCTAAVAMPAAATAAGCDGSNGSWQTTIECHTERERTDPNLSASNRAAISHSSQASWLYIWLPPCPGAIPARSDARNLECAAMHTCPEGAVQLTLWGRQLTTSTGDRTSLGWTAIQTECRSPSEAGPVRQRRALTWSDVLSAVRQVGVPAASVEAPGYTLVNLDTTFYTEPPVIERRLSIIGYRVDVRIEPTSYTWHWGDGTTTTTSQPGRPYPATDVTHTYVRATEAVSPLALRVYVTYSADYRVDGGPWLTVPESLTIRGSDTLLPVKQAAAVLVGED